MKTASSLPRLIGHVTTYEPMNQEERSKDLSLFVHECMRVIDSEYHDDMMVDVLEETASSLHCG